MFNNAFFGKPYFGDPYFGPGEEDAPIAPQSLGGPSKRVRLEAELLRLRLIREADENDVLVIATALAPALAGGH